MGSKMVLYWVHTHDQLADEASRFVDFNEEFVPKTLFQEFCDQIRVTPTVDVFATRANKKCNKWIRDSDMVIHYLQNETSTDRTGLAYKLSEKIRKNDFEFLNDIPMDK